MKKGTGLIMIGAILIIAAIGIYALMTLNIGLEAMEIPAHGEKTINYNITGGNYTLVIKTNGPVHYSFYNSSIIMEGNVTDHVVKYLNLTKGTYSLKIENTGNNSVALAVGLKSQESLMSLGIQVLGSGGVCLTGIIILAVGVWFVMRERRRENSVH